MQTLVLSAQNIEQLVQLDELRAVMKQTMQELSLDQATSFPRQVVELADGALGFMLAQRRKQLLGYKAVAVFPRNARVGLNPHQGMVILLDAQTGRVRALLEGAAITALRTAAVSAVATQFLAGEAGSTLGLVGAGRQAYEHARALLKVRTIRRILVWARRAAQSAELAARLCSEFEVHAESVESLNTLTSQCEILVTATSSATPLLASADLLPGAHVNAVGSCRPGAHEMDLTSHAQLRIFLDSRAACALEADELSVAQPRDIYGELGEALNGKIAGRVNAHDVTVFKSVGLGIQDVAAAEYFYQQALARNQGQWVSL
jgi:alanine dehydrogenase